MDEILTIEDDLPDSENDNGLAALFPCDMPNSLSGKPSFTLKAQSLTLFNPTLFNTI